MSRYEELQRELKAKPRKWCVTGAAGFIGSHLVENLLDLGQEVNGVDNLSTGHRRNVESFAKNSRFKFFEGEINDGDLMRKACNGVTYVLHQAALGSVPRSIEEPENSNRANVDGFLSALVAARDAKVEKFVYASSSSVYGDAPDLPMREAVLGSLLSPYAATKRINELYAGVFTKNYALKTVGLRYFNVFGPRQDPNGAYAAVIPRWIASLMSGEVCTINGDGETSRDFCFVANVVQANLLAATSNEESGLFNIACGETTSLNALYGALATAIHGPDAPKPRYQPFRQGDIRHSYADISAARARLGYEPVIRINEGIARTVDSYSPGPKASASSGQAS